MPQQQSTQRLERFRRYANVRYSVFYHFCCDSDPPHQSPYIIVINFAHSEYRDILKALCPNSQNDN